MAADMVYYPCNPEQHHNHLNPLKLVFAGQLLLRLRGANEWTVDNLSRCIRVQELILFLTDGGAAFPESEVTALLADHGKRIKRLTCVAFGQGADTRVLTKIGAKFQEQNISFKLHDANSQESLVAAFKEAAGGRAIHCK